MPTTLAEFTAAMDKFVAAGTTPLCMAGAEYPAGQLAYQLALTKADRSFVDDYQLYKNPVDFQADPLKYGADTFDAWVKAGYISQDSASLKAEDMGTGFIGGKCPMIVSGSWWFGRFADEIKGFDWGTFLFPGSQLSLGSSGNIWVVPEASKNKDLAYDFIDITMRPEIQELIGNSGGIPVAADPSKITDPKNQELIANFNKINDGRRPGVLPGLARARLLRRAGVRIPVADQPVEDARRGAGPDRGPVPRGRCDHPGRLTRFIGPTKWSGPAARHEPPARPSPDERERHMSDIAEVGGRVAAHDGPVGAPTTPGTTMTTQQSPPRTNKSVGFSSRPYWLYLIPGGLLFVAVILGPLIYNVYLSLTKWSGVGQPKFIGLDNYIKLMGDSVFWESFKNSVAMIIAMVVIPTVIGLLLASVLFDYLGKRFGNSSASVLRAVFYLPQVLPVVVAGIVWGWILRPDGAFNAFLDLIGLQGFTRDWLGDPNTALPMVMLVMVWVQIGYPVVIFMSALQRVDPEIYEAAEIDGAGYWARFRAITVPQIRPETFVVALTCTIAALKVFGPIYALTRGGPENATNVPSYFAYFTFFKKLNVGYGAAIATVLTLIIVVVAVAIMRWQARSEQKEAA